MALLVDNDSQLEADMVVPTPEVADAVLLGMVRSALYPAPAETDGSDDSDDVAGHVLIRASMPVPTYPPGLAGVVACGRAVWAWRGVDEELGALLCQSGDERRRP